MPPTLLRDPLALGEGRWTPTRASRRLAEVLYDDGTRIVYTYDDAGNRLTQVARPDLKTRGY